MTLVLEPEHVSAICRSGRAVSTSACLSLQEVAAARKAASRAAKAVAAQQQQVLQPAPESQAAAEAALQGENIAIKRYVHDSLALSGPPMLGLLGLAPHDAAALAV